MPSIDLSPAGLAEVVSQPAPLAAHPDFTALYLPAGAGFIVTLSAWSLDARGERLRKTDVQTFAFTATGDDADEPQLWCAAGGALVRGAILSRWRGTS